MKLIVGLGNIGEKYSRTRHNIGFIALDNFAEEHSLTFKKEKNYFYAKHKNAILIKPRTYMNLSGVAVQSVMTKFNIDDILVLVDDMDLPFGKIRIRKSGGTGGHNGLKSIAGVLGGNEYGRIRIGIGRPSSQEVKQFVLAKFSKDEQDKISILNDYLKDLLGEYLANGVSHLLNYNSANNKTYSEKIGIN
jgi:PTH1 family peptidyl-tRNA hydrolase